MEVQVFVRIFLHLSSNLKSFYLLYSTCFEDTSREHNFMAISYFIAFVYVWDFDILVINNEI